MSDLTANDLAETLGVHWWIVKLPSDLGLQDKVGVELVDSDGKRLEGGGGFSRNIEAIKLGSEMRVYCWEDAATGYMKVASALPGGGFAVNPMTDYLKGAASSGPGNGAVMNVGDNLIILDQSKTPSFNGGYTLQPGQVGLRVCIEHRP